MPEHLCDPGERCPCSRFLAQHGAKATAAVRAIESGSLNSIGSSGLDRPMPGMSMSAPQTLIDEILQHGTAGTSAEPASAPHPMFMKQVGPWMLMFHGSAWINDTQQTGPRGADKFFSTSWLMPMAQHSLGPGTLTMRAMFSLEPATVTDRQYPELFQLGETAYGKPIVDGQHPHNFIMEIAALYDIKIGEHALLSLYGAPVGDPALGPEAYPHRASASEDPLAPLGHHLQDSTHISYDVVTVGWTYWIARVELSGFHGREPGENRWTIDSGAIDSWSTRLTVSPAPNWSGQYSIGRLHSPEGLFPLEDTLRMTASVMYNRPFAAWGNWASTLIWGRNETLPGGEIYTSYLGESTLRFARRNYAWTRVENVDRTNLLLLGENPLPPGFEETFLARVEAYTAGYDREFELLPHISSALGGQLIAYGKPEFLTPVYAGHPFGFLLILHLRPTSPGH